MNSNYKEYLWRTFRSIYSREDLQVPKEEFMEWLDQYMEDNNLKLEDIDNEDLDNFWEWYDPYMGMQEDIIVPQNQFLLKEDWSDELVDPETGLAKHMSWSEYKWKLEEIRDNLEDKIFNLWRPKSEDEEVPLKEIEKLEAELEEVKKELAEMYNVEKREREMEYDKFEEIEESDMLDVQEQVAAPITTLTNIPGMGSAQPAKMAAMTGSQQGSPDAIGSGDLWGTSKTKKKKKKKKINEIEYMGHGAEASIPSQFENVYKVGERWYRRWKIANEYDYNFTEDDRHGIYLVCDKRGKHILTFLPKIGKVYTNLNPEKLNLIKEMEEGENINPYDKIGVSIAKKMKVPLTFKKGKRGTVSQKTYESQNYKIMSLDTFINLSKD